MDFSTTVFGSFTVQDVLTGGAVMAGIIILFFICKKLFTRKPENVHVQQVRCPGCDWQGQVSRYAGVCPRCNSPLGDRNAKPRTK